MTARKTSIVGLLVLLVISIAFIVINSKGNANNTGDNIVRHMSGIIVAYPFEESVVQSDLIVNVSFSKVVGEIHKPIDQTIHEAKVNEVYKGSNDLEGNKIRILQLGNSRVSFDDNEIFKEGDNYILFLKKAKGVGFENTYFVLGEQTSFYKINGSEISNLSRIDESISDIIKSSSVEDFKDRVIFDKTTFIEKIKTTVNNNENEKKKIIMEKGVNEQ